MDVGTSSRLYCVPFRLTPWRLPELTHRRACSGKTTGKPLEMSLVRLESVVKRLGGNAVVDGVDFRVEEGEKIGLIGRNGSGKTTIFRLITGEIEPDGGTIERMRRARIACLSQIPDLGPQQTIFDVVMASFRELLAQEQELAALERRIADDHDPQLLDRYGTLQEDFAHRGGYEFRTSAKRVLHGLGFTTSDFDLHVNALSGGQRTRLMLALVLLQDADLLLLDEPENHLDLEAYEWLETFLNECPKGVVIISHDRRMLNGVASRIVEIERGKLTSYTGNYDFYRAQKALVREQQQKAFDSQQEFINKETKWINRFRYKNTKASQVQSRLKRLEKMERAEAPPPEMAVSRIRFGEVVRSGQMVVDAKALAMAYGDLRLYEGLSFQVTRGERVGIIGPNGSGKTTLLRQLAGRLPAGRGTVTLGHKVEMGFYEQHQDALRSAGAAGNDILAEIRQFRPDMTPERVRTFMGGFLFKEDDIFKPLNALSGGEVSRVAMAKLILSGANLLLLDEPTNHLDIASREAIEEALAAFPGSILMVSHDRTLIDRLVDKIIVIADGKATLHLGNYSAYRNRQGLDGSGRAEAPRIEAAATPDRSDALRIRSGQAAKGSANTKDANKELQRRRKKLQTQIEELEHDIESVEQLLESFDQKYLELAPSDYEGARSLKQEQDGLHQDLQAMYAEWESLAEQVSAMGKP